MTDAPPEPSTWQQVLAGERRWACACSDALAFLRQLPDNSVNCCVTSPPYYALRDYGTGKWVGGDPACDHKRSKTMRPGRNENRPLLGDSLASNSGQLVLAANSACRCGAVREDDQLGLEESPDAYIARLVALFREVRRVLRKDGTCWVNLGDSYANDPKGPRSGQSSTLCGTPDWQPAGPQKKYRGGDIKKKDLIGIPWMFAFAARSDGWYLRSDIIWAKTNPMPESVRDRPTKSHEYLFLLTKSADYHFDADAIAEACTGTTVARVSQPNHAGQQGSRRQPGKNKPMKAAVRTPKVNGGASFGKQNHDATGTGAKSRVYERPVYVQRNRRSVWRLATARFSGAHFAVMPAALVEPCVLAGCPADGVVIDIFTGSGTTAAVANSLGRRFVGCELNPDYLELIGRRMAKVSPTLFDGPRVAATIGTPTEGR